ncbi:OprD family porin [Pseudomonas citronellolis]|uniref:OprD family porin n=1 Tax=Pseudomonas citronellolis TaxID=53408 RepID=UPI0023E38026|nr:OprD family porin [Pseudomonas citronellolis]MDF3934909.1 OprD family porin [Pseudomonas citronellolis]
MNRLHFTPALFGLALTAGFSFPACAEDDDPRGQAGATGFVEGQKLTFSTRNFFANERKRDSFYFHIPKADGSEPTRDRHTWVQGNILQYSSGYTQGTVGFGLDLAGFNAINLERGKGAIAGGGNRTLTDSDGEALEQWSKLGIANLRLRVSSTELKAGRFQVETPVFNSIDNRALPSSFNGIGLLSEEFRGLSLQGGSFTRASPRTGAGDEDFTTEYGTRQAKGDRYSYLGGTWKALDNLSLSAYGGHFEDVWNQYYFGFSHDLGDAQELALNSSFNLYSTRDTGTREAGYIDNDTWSLAFTLSRGAHALMLAWQQVEGNEYFDYVHETSAMYLANSLFSDYNGPNEKSLQLRYSTDFAPYGMPGLSTSVWYAKGWDIDGTHYAGDRNGAYGNYAEVRAQDGEKHHELGLTGTYVVQDGALKRSKIRLMYVKHLASQNQADGSLDEVRLVSTFPFDLL